MYPFHQTKGLHYGNRDFTMTFTRLHGGKHTLRFCPGGDLSKIECKVVSTKTKEICMHVFYDSICPVKKLPEFSLYSSVEDLELIILQHSKEVIKLSAYDPPKFAK